MINMLQDLDDDDVIRSDSRNSRDACKRLSELFTRRVLLSKGIIINQKCLQATSNAMKNITFTNESWSSASM